jgi:23S rRNA (adenine-N6)-dimethyltransferase
VSAAKRTPRDERRRRLGQNFLRPDLADALVADAAFSPGDLVVEIGPGRGACTFALARRGVRVLAWEQDPAWADALRAELGRRRIRNVTVVCGDALEAELPTRSFRVFGSLPFGATTALLRKLLGDPSCALQRADVVVQFEVARKRAAIPPSTALSTAWAPWWTFELGRRIPARAFRPVPRVDGAMLHVARRQPPLLPLHMASAYVDFVKRGWK